MAVPVVNLRIDKGTSFEATFNVTNSDGSPFNLTGHNASAKIKKHPTSNTSKSFDVSIVASTGEITISMGSSVTSELSAGINIYDVVITEINDGKVSKVFEGNVTVYESISI